MTSVLVCRYLPPRLLDRIAAVDERVEVLHDRRLAQPAAGRLGVLYRAEDRVDAATTAPRPFGRDDEERWLELMGRAEVMFDVDPAYLDAIPARTPSLRWIQGIAAGAGELFRCASLRESSVEVATARGVHDDPLADFALMAVLANGKRLDVLRAQQAERRWQEIPNVPLAGQVMCVVGLGSIGAAIATRARAFGMRVTGVRRTARPSELAERVHPPAEIRTAVADADYVAVTLPGTRETRALIDAGTIAAMKPGAYLVNVGRGSVIDEDALTEALRSGHLAGAALDVFATEPLPVESPLWDLPNVIVSPHSTAVMPGTSIERMVDLFCTNLRRDLAGEPLLHLADKDAAY